MDKDDVTDFIERDRLWRKAAHPVRYFFEDYVYWPLWHLWESYLNPVNHYYDIRDFIIRGRRGWCPRDVWSFDDYLARVIAEGCIHLRDSGCGYPADTADDQWKAALTQISDGMRAHMKLNELDYDYKDPERKEEKELSKIKAKGLKLFCAHFSNLWD